jgi:hypothetical protein
MTATEPRVLAEVRSYSELHAALRARSDALSISRQTLDDLTGLQDGYCAKLLAPTQIKNLGPQSLGPLLCVLGVKLIMVEDAEMLRKFGPRLVRRQNAGNGVLAKAKRRKTRQYRSRANSSWGRRMRALQLLKQPPKDRTRIAKHAAVIRWADVKKAMQR